MVGAISAAIGSLAGLTSKLIGNKNQNHGVYTQNDIKLSYEREEMTMLYVILALVALAVAFTVIVMIIKKT